MLAFYSLCLTYYFYCSISPDLIPIKTQTPPDAT